MSVESIHRDHPTRHHLSRSVSSVYPTTSCSLSAFDSYISRECHCRDFDRASRFGKTCVKRQEPEPAPYSLVTLKSSLTDVDGQLAAQKEYLSGRDVQPQSPVFDRPHIEITESSSLSTVSSVGENDIQTVGTQTTTDTEFSACSAITKPEAIPDSLRCSPKIHLSATRCRPLTRPGGSLPLQSRGIQCNTPSSSISPNTSSEDKKECVNEFRASSMSKHIERPDAIENRPGKLNYFSVFNEDDDEGSDDPVIHDGNQDEATCDWEDCDDKCDSSPSEEPHLFKRIDPVLVHPPRQSLLTAMMANRSTALNAESSARNSTARTPAPKANCSIPSSPTAQPMTETKSFEPRFSYSTLSHQANPETSTQTQKPTERNISTKVHRAPCFPSEMSPRTTRRNMASHELTASLRTSLLLGRKHSSSTDLFRLQTREVSGGRERIRQRSEPMIKPLIAPHHGQGTSTSNELELDSCGFRQYHLKGW